MLTSFRGLMAVTLATAGLSLATPAMAQSEDSGFTTSANVALTTDYRFRGVSLSGGFARRRGGARSTMMLLLANTRSEYRSGMSR